MSLPEAYGNIREHKMIGGARNPRMAFF